MQGSYPTKLRVEKALRERASRGRSTTPSWGRTVEGAVRAFLPVIEEVKPDLTWDEIAGVLAEAGVAWRNGRPVSGSDLRSVVYRLRLKARAEGASAVTAPAKSGASVTRGSIPSEGDAAVRPRREEAKVLEGVDRGRILREMARAASERRVSNSFPAASVAAETSGAKMQTTSIQEAHPHERGKN